MKVLIVGGAHQGKRRYAAGEYGGVTLDGVHLAIRERMRRGSYDRDAMLEELDGDNWVIISDEIGCGIIPIGRFDREWREEVGRLCCMLAERADIVERVSCGIPLRLKGGRR